MTGEELREGNLALERERLALEREKWLTDCRIRDAELDLRVAEQRSKEAELDLKRQEQTRAGWWNPVVVAIFAAAIAAAGNAVVTIVNGTQERAIENQRSEQTRILEMIKTGDTEVAAENLEFLLDAGLIDDPDRARKIREYLVNREPGRGPALPGAFPPVGIIGPDDAKAIESLQSTDPIRRASRAVGQLRTEAQGNTYTCTAFLIASDLVLTANHCVNEAERGFITFSDGDSAATHDIVLPPLTTSAEDNFALLRVDGNPGATWGQLELRAEPPKVDELLAGVLFRGADRKQVVLSSDCRILAVEPRQLAHLCDTGGGSSGAPMLTSDGRYVIGLHHRRSTMGGIATRADTILTLVSQPER